MIKSFRCKETEALFNHRRVKRFTSCERAALRKLAQLEISGSLHDLRIPPANRLEALIGDRSGQYSIRINDRWRVCFEWRDGDAWNVEIVDYH
jgi:proteic killer suppression protein